MRAQCSLVTGVVLGYIPSPSSGTFSLGPLTLHMYGVMLLLGSAAYAHPDGVRAGVAAAVEASR